MYSEFDRALFKCISRMIPYTEVDGIEYFYTISREKNKSWEGWKLIDEYKNNPSFPDCIFDLHPLQDQVSAFYRQKYWRKLCFDEFEFDDKVMILNASILYGTTAANKMIADTLEVISKLDEKYQDDFWFRKIYRLHCSQLFLRVIKGIPKQNAEILLERFL